jgi:crotonobetainyl-CoA:carnitine CoA-transferase CaiB-like acyl-CoA transferase
MNTDPKPAAAPRAAAALPLAGVRIVDLSSIVLGPLATLTLAGLGAEVIKVEALDGDNVRHAGVARHDGMGHVFLHGNRGKKSVALNLKHASARQALLALLREADVFVSNVRPAAMQRLGLGPQVLQQANPRLIQVTACGYGSAGPYADRPAYDDLIQGAAGVPWLMQQYGGGEPAYVPLSLADRVTGLHLVYAVTAALYARERSGLGQQVEVPMFESVAHFVLADHLAGRSFEPAQGRAGYDRLLSRHRRPYRTADGYLCVLIYNDKHWRSFLGAIGQPDLIDDPRFRTQRQRSRHIDEVYDWVASVMQGRTTAQWCRLLEGVDIPHQVPASLDDLIDDPQLRASGLVFEEEHPSEGHMHVLGEPTRWAGAAPASLAPAPTLGQHGVEVLRGLGYSDDQLARMAQEGAIGPLS